MTDDQLYTAEKNELNLLINKGVQFEIERKEKKKLPGFFGYFKKRIEVKVVDKFTVNEPTLSVLDRIAAEQIELKIDENVMSSESGIQEAKIMTKEHGMRLARIVAISVLGLEFRDKKKLTDLTNLFYENIKPSKLMQLTVLINTMSNYGDFTNSIRLMSAARTTMPVRIEENKKD